MEEIHREVGVLWREMIIGSSLDIWSDEMNMAIAPVLAVLDELMKNLGISGGIPNNVVATITPSYIYALQMKWESEF